MTKYPDTIKKFVDDNYKATKNEAIENIKEIYETTDEVIDSNNSIHYQISHDHDDPKHRPAIFSLQNRRVISNIKEILENLEQKYS